MIKEIDQQEWEAILDQDPNAVILDVRTDAEIEENGHIEDMIQIDILQPEVFVQKIKDLDPEKTFLIYCRSGKRSAQACAVMSQNGFKNLYSLIGGFTEFAG